ncbi:bZip transcription factor protein [Rutstroemia sp. NJR-2017a BBW]|nr:bZip transcription factor protein [Rutstroemia sp. NJR-2017a BBW]
MSADNELRSQLMTSISHSQPHNIQAHGYNNHDVQASSSASPHDHNIDPGLGGPMMSESGGDDGDGRKGGKRELSQSKRAAQNRAAQRAFRQRKEGYIKKLEEQVRDFHSLEENYKAIHAENYSLREYIIRLQSRLIESQGEFPQPPPNINLSHSSTHPHPQQRQHESLEHMQRQHDGAPVAPMGQIGNTIQASRTIAAAGLKHSGEESQQYNQQPETKRFKEDDANDENLIRSQLTADGLPPPVPL